MTARSRLLVLALAVAIASPALAVGPSREVVQERLYRLDGRFGLSLLGGVSLNNKLANHVGLVLQPVWHFTDAWAVEASLGGFAGLEKKQLTGDIIAQTSSLDELNSEFADTGTIQWLAHASLRWAPVYGKLSLASELPVYLGAYVTAGGGMMGVQRTSLVTCQNVGDPDGDGQYEGDCETTNEATPGVNLGAGLRMHLGENLSLRAELRDFVFQDRYREYIGTADEREVTGLSSLLMLMAGVSYYF